LKKLVEQISVIETSREIDAETLNSYLPHDRGNVPAVVNKESKESIDELELMYKFLFDMKKDLNDLKKLVVEMISKGGDMTLNHDQADLLNRMYTDVGDSVPETRILPSAPTNEPYTYQANPIDNDFEVHEEVEESLSLEDREKELIQKALTKHKGKRKYAAAELGISERTLYRKIKEYNLTD